MLKKFVIVAIGAAAMFVAAAFHPSPALAYLKLCNESGEKVWATIAYYDSSYQYYISEGWWSIEPEGCKTVLSYDLKDRYYYVYGHSSNLTWSGDYSFCVDPDNPFTLYNAGERCSGEWRKFRKFDTGDYKDFKWSFLAS